MVRMLLFAAALLLPAAALAQHAAKSQSANHDDAADAPAAAQAAADPATGRLRAPTREEAKALADAVAATLNHSAADRPVVVRADGARSIDLTDRFESVSVARVAGGKAEARCVTSPEEARRFAAGELPAPKPAPIASETLEVE